MSDWEYKTWYRAVKVLKNGNQIHYPIWRETHELAEEDASRSKESDKSYSYIFIETTQSFGYPGK